MEEKDVRDRCLRSDTLSDSQREQLIEEVERRPCLFAVRTSEYLDEEQKDRCWEDIARILSSNSDVVRREWRRLRLDYNQYLRGSSSKNKSKPWRFARQLRFLDSHLASSPIPFLQSYETSSTTVVKRERISDEETTVVNAGALENVASDSEPKWIQLRNRDTRRRPGFPGRRPPRKRGRGRPAYAFITSRQLYLPSSQGHSAESTVTNSNETRNDQSTCTSTDRDFNANPIPSTSTCDRSSRANSRPLKTSAPIHQELEASSSTTSFLDRSRQVKNSSPTVTTTPGGKVTPVKRARADSNQVEKNKASNNARPKNSSAVAKRSPSKASQLRSHNKKKVIVIKGRLLDKKDVKKNIDVPLTTNVADPPSIDNGRNSAQSPSTFNDIQKAVSEFFLQNKQFYKSIPTSSNISDNNNQDCLTDASLTDTLDLSRSYRGPPARKFLKATAIDKSGGRSDGMLCQMYKFIPTPTATVGGKSVTDAPTSETLINTLNSNPQTVATFGNPSNSNLDTIELATNADNRECSSVFSRSASVDGQALVDPQRASAILPSPRENNGSQENPSLQLFFSSMYESVKKMTAMQQGAVKRELFESVMRFENGYH